MKLKFEGGKEKMKKKITILIVTLLVLVLPLTGTMNKGLSIDEYAQYSDKLIVPDISGKFTYSVLAENNPEIPLPPP